MISHRIKLSCRLTGGIILLLTLTIFNVRTNAVEASSKTDTLDYKWERFSFKLGGFLAGQNSNVQLGSQSLGLGLVVNVEDALGLQITSTVVRSEVQYDFGKRKRSTASLEYFGLFRGANKVLGSDVELGDHIFPVGTEVNSRFNLQIYKAKYSYAFYKDERVRLDASFGLFVMPTSFSVKAMDRSGTATDFVAPLPVLGGGSIFAITPKLYFEQNIDFLYLKIANFKGAITDVNFRVEYNAWEHFGFGGGLNTFRLNIDALGTKENYFDFKGTFKTNYTGLLLYVKYYL